MHDFVQREAQIAPLQCFDLKAISYNMKGYLQQRRENPQAGNKLYRVS